mgnify:CR=1 FL=1
MPDWIITPGLTDYDDAVATMEARANAIAAGEAEELDVIGILCHLLGKLRVRRGELAVKVR